MRRIHSKSASMLLVALVLGAVALSSGRIGVAPDRTPATAQDRNDVEPAAQRPQRASQTSPRPADLDAATAHHASREFRARRMRIDALEHENKGPTLRRAIEDALDAVSNDQPVDLQSGVLDEITAEGRARILFSVLPRDALEHDAGEALVGWVAATQTAQSFRSFSRLPFAGASVDGEALIELIATGATDHIELDAVHRPSLDTSLPLISADTLHADGFDGDGYAVAILDTGIDVTHPMYVDRLIEEACFSLLGDCPNDQNQMLGPGSAVPCAASGCGHGTSVAGIAVGREPGDRLLGVAPNADLIAIQIFSIIDNRPGAYSSDIVAALQHVLGLAPFHDIASVNLSLGGDTFATAAACDQSRSAQYWAVEALRAEGIVVVAAAGNDAAIDQIASPACLSNVLSVGAIRDDGSIPSFSNSADFLSLLAPGQSIESSANGGGTSFVSGTSMATPHVAGAVAALREAYPTASTNELENTLQLSGVPITDVRNGISVPRIDVDAAEAILATLPPGGSAGGGTPTPSTGSGGANPAAAAAGGGGGGGCGLIGIEPFLVLGAIRLARFRRIRRARQPAC